MAIAVYLPNNVGLTGLEVSRTTTFQNFALYAPLAEPTGTGGSIPKPATVMLLGLLSVPLLTRRR